MIYKNATAKISKRDGVLPSGRVVKRIYTIELYEDGNLVDDHLVPYLSTPEKAIIYLRSTGNSYRNIDVYFENGAKSICINQFTEVVDYGKMYGLFYRGELKKRFRTWNRLQEFLVSSDF